MIFYDFLQFFDGFLRLWRFKAIAQGNFTDEKFFDPKMAAPGHTTKVGQVAAHTHYSNSEEG